MSQSCNDKTTIGYDTPVSCEKRAGHDDPYAEIGGRRTDPIHRETIPGNPTKVVEWWYDR